MPDPATATVLAAGVSTIDGDEYYDGDERRILSILDQRFAVLDPGIITTWNGSLLDLPLLRARAKALELGLGLRVKPDRRRHRKNGGRRVPVCGAWHHQRHLDLRWVYGDAATADDTIGLDPSRGAHLARSLAERRWIRARRHLDRVPPQTADLTSYAWACIAPDHADGPTVTAIPASARARHPSAGPNIGRHL